MARPARSLVKGASRVEHLYGSRGRMPRIIVIAAATAVTVAWSASAQQAVQTGNDLLDACRIAAAEVPSTPNNSFQVGVCLGEIEALEWLAPGQENERLRSCVPSNITRQHMAKVVVAYLDHNHDRLREQFEGLALEALASTWPCHDEPSWFEKLFGKEPD